MKKDRKSFQKPPSPFAVELFNFVVFIYRTILLSIDNLNLKQCLNRVRYLHDSCLLRTKIIETSFWCLSMNFPWNPKKKLIPFLSISISIWVCLSIWIEQTNELLLYVYVRIVPSCLQFHKNEICFEQSYRNVCSIYFIFFIIFVWIGSKRSKWIFIVQIKPYKS